MTPTATSSHTARSYDSYEKPRHSTVSRIGNPGNHGGENQVHGAAMEGLDGFSPVPQDLASDAVALRHLFIFWTRRELGIIGLAILASALVAGAKASYSVILGKIFDIVATLGSGTSTPDEALSRIAKWCLALAGLGAFKALSAFLLMALWITNGEKRVREVRSHIFSSLLGMEMAWFDSRHDGMGSPLTALHTQTRELQMATSQLFGQVVCDAFISMACLVIAFRYCWELTLVLLASVPPSVLILGLLGRRLEPAMNAQRVQLGDASKYATASLLAIDIVKVYNGYDEELWEYVQRLRRAGSHYLVQARCACSQMGFVKCWMVALFVTGLWFGIFLVQRERSTPGSVLTTFYAVLTAFQSIEALGTQWLTVAKGMAAGQSMERLALGPGGDSLTRNTGGVLAPRKPTEDIELIDVSFAYPSNPSKLVLQPSSFFFPSHEFSFIVGRSGSGKSTIADLLVKFYFPTSGRILLGSVPSESVDSGWLREHVTLVQQSSTIFRGTFGMNVSLGKMNPRESPTNEILSACQTALLQSTLNSLPEGLDTIIGPGGHALSGGQTQRLALARAKLRDPSVLILDEVTSGLDPLSASLIMEAIRTWRRGKTTIIITHDVSQIEMSDYVYVMEKGSVIQEGYFKSIAHEEGSLLHSMLLAADDSETLASPTSLDIDHRKSTGRPLDEEGLVSASATKLFFHPGNEGPATGNGLFRGMSSLARVGQRQSVIAGLAGIRPYSNASLSRDPGFRMLQARGQYARGERERSPTARESATSFHDPSHGTIDKSSRSNGNGVDGDDWERNTISMWNIFIGVWPRLGRLQRLSFVAGFLGCLVVAGGNPAFSYLFAQILQAFWAPGNKESVGRKWAIILLTLGCIDGLAVFLGFYLLERTGQVWVDRLRTEALKRVLRQPKTWFDESRHSPSRIVDCLDGNAEEMRKLIGTFLPIIVIASGMVAASLVWAMTISWNLALVTLSAGPIVIGLSRWASATSNKWEARCDRASETTSAVFHEVFSNIRVVRALTLEEHFTQEFETSARAAFKLGISRAWRTGLLFGATQAVADWLTALVFYYGVKLLTYPEARIGVADIMQVINLLLFSIGTATVMLGNIPQISAAKAMAMQMLHYASLSLHASHEHEGGARIRNMFPIQMNSLQFRYPGRPDTTVLRSLDLDINAGEVVAVVGPSGCGKSTILSMLLRLYEPEETERQPPPLTFGDIAAPDLDTVALRHRMSYVPQRPFLFPRSVRDNIAYGLHDDAPQRQRPELVAAAARAAGIHDLVASLPQGYDTPVGDGGLALSGGQAQRLCIARALARRPALLVLDEPTSALDAESAEGIRATVRAVGAARQTAVVVVTHSREMMRVADRLVVVDGGVVVANAPYSQLVRRDRRFRELVGE